MGVDSHFAVIKHERNKCRITGETFPILRESSLQVGEEATEEWTWDKTIPLGTNLLSVATRREREVERVAQKTKSRRNQSRWRKKGALSNKEAHN